MKQGLYTQLVKNLVRKLILEDCVIDYDRGLNKIPSEDSKGSDSLCLG